MIRKPSFYAAFDAAILWMLEPFVEYGRDQGDDRFINGNIFVEPASQGGAYVGAVCNHAMLVVHDADAVCREAHTLCIPHLMFHTAAPPPPVHMTYCGECYLLPPPEWTMPGVCNVSSAGIFIQPKMRPPIFAEEDDTFWPALDAVTASVGTHRVGVDYRATKGVPADWRKPLKNVATEASPAETPSFAANPEILSLFDRAYKTAIDQALADDRDPPHMHFSLNGPSGAIIVLIDTRPDIIGCLMPMKAPLAPTVPWHFLKSPKRSTPSTKDRADG